MNLVGEHHFRFGFDQEDNTLDHGTVRTGGAVLCGSGFLSDAACTASGGGGAAILYRPADPGSAFPNRGQVEINYLVSGGGFTARNKAFYIQDEWSPTDRLTLSLGLRRDDFRLNKQDGSSFLQSKENYAPRIGLTYEMWPDHSGKFKAFYGRYYLPFASNTANRQASSEIYFRERFYYSAIDGNGIPTLDGQVTDYAAYNSTCPFGLTDQSSGMNCNVSGIGTVPDTSQSTNASLKATRETEWIVGYEQQVSGWNVGLTYTHRNLDSTAEDVAIDAAARKYCIDSGVDAAACNDQWYGYNQYVITNPGTDMTVALLAPDIPSLDGKVVTLSAEDLGYPKAKRTYDAIELEFSHPFNGVWSLAGSYTWSKSKGNSEGFVQSDFGQDDAGITQDFDQPGFTEYAYGYLPNDRRHRFKLYGSYAVTPAFIIGTQIQVQSPRHLSCFGYYPVEDSLENGYGAASHYCGGQPSPRGTGLKSNWYSNVDLSGRYNINIPTGQLVTLRVDVFNLFNEQAVMQRDEIGENGYLNPSPNYGVVTAYQTARYVRFGADITF